MTDIRSTPPAAGAARTPATRPAEETNRETGIDKEDLERHRRGKSLARDHKPLDIYEDLSEVSVALLRGFLQGLVETREKVQGARTAKPAAPYAMQAYQSAMRTAPEAPPPPTIEEDAEVAGFTRLELAAEGLDQTEIIEVMDRLEKLEGAGIHFISLERSTSFLQSIRDGINRAIEGTIAQP